MLTELSKQFLACVPVVEVKKLLDAMAPSLFTEEFQTQLVACTIRHSTAQAFPPRTAYIKHFFKCVVSKLEAHNVDIIDDLYIHYADQLSNRCGDENAPGFVTYVIDDHTAVTLKEHSAVVLNGTTGLRTWEASKCLSEWCLENKNLLCGRHVLELGCGVGLTGLVVCKTCDPLSYTFTDGHDTVLQTMRENLLQNNIAGCNTRVDILRWGNPEDYKELCPDVILGADLVFDPAVVQLLVTTLAALLSHGGVAYIASTIRNPQTRSLFLADLDAASLRHEPCTLPQEQVFFYNRSCPIEIYKIVAQTRLQS